METAILQMISSFIGSFGFAALYNLHGRKLWTAGLGGMISWVVYLAVQFMTENNFLVNMFAAMAATIYAEMMARILKTPATIYLISAIIPLVPGGNLYYTMNYAIAKDWHLFYLYGQKTIIAATAIAGGIMMASSFFRLYQEIRHDYRKRRIR